MHKEGNREEEERKKRADLNAKRKRRREKLRYVVAFLVKFLSEMDDGLFSSNATLRRMSVFACES